MQVIHDDMTVSAGGLIARGANAVNTKIQDIRDQGARIVKMKVEVSAHEFLGVNNKFVYGLCGNLTDGEVAAALNADPSGIGDHTSADAANLPVYPLGTIPRDADYTTNDEHIVFPMQEVHYPWKEIPEGDSLRAFIWSTAIPLVLGTPSLDFQFVFVTKWLED